jgi:hypothetical protein
MRALDSSEKRYKIKVKRKVIWFLSSYLMELKYSSNELNNIRLVIVDSIFIFSKNEKTKILIYYNYVDIKLFIKTGNDLVPF